MRPSAPSILEISNIIYDYYTSYTKWAAAPVVAMVWGHQERLETADLSGLRQFIHDFRNGPWAPEPAGPCDGTNLLFSGGAGSPHR